MYGETDLRQIASDIYDAVYTLSVDSHGPVLQSATINADGDELTLVFDEPVTGNSGFTLDAEYGAVTLTYSSGEGTDTLVYTISRAIGEEEDVALDYTAGDIEDTRGNPMEDFSGQSVTNDSEVFNPNQLAGLVAQYDVSNAASVTKDGSNFISSLANLGTAAYPITAAGTLRPVWTPNQLNGLPVAIFDGVDDRMTTGAQTLNQPETVFLVFKAVTNSDGGQRVTDGAGALATLFLPAGSQLAIYAGSSVLAGIGTLVTGDWYIVSYRFSGASSFIRQNLRNKVTGNAGANNPGGFVLGAQASGAIPSNIAIGEALVYNVSLSDADEELVINYLEDKWNAFTNFFVDDFNRADTPDNNIGNATSGQSWTLSGSGSANVRILNQELTMVSPFNTFYAWPNIEFKPKTFACRFTLHAGGGAGAYVMAMIMSALPVSLDNMLHMTWNALGGGIEVWENGGADHETIVTWSHAALSVDTPYELILEIDPVANSVTITPPVGSPVSGINAKISTYWKPYIAWEISSSDTSALQPAFDEVWANP